VLGATRIREYRAHGRFDRLAAADAVRGFARSESGVDGAANGEGPFEDYVGRRAQSFRRRLILVAVLAVVTFVGVSAGLALRQYRHAQHSALQDLRSRAVVGATVINTSFGGDVATLNAIVSSPAFVSGDRTRMRVYLERLQAAPGAQFNGGIGWIDRNGVVRVSTTAPRGARPVSVADRTYFRHAIADGRPYVSGGIVSRRSKQPVVVVAVPTRTADGRISGVLAASIRLRAVNNSRSELELGYQGLAIVDRGGRLLFSGLGPVHNQALLARIRRETNGVIAGTPGLGGHGNDVVAYATAQLPAWLVVIDRPRSSVDAAAWRSFVLQLVSLAAAALVVVGLALFVVRRSRRDRELQDARARAWSGVTRELGASATSEDISDALADSLATAFPDALAVVVLEAVEGIRKVRAPRTRSWRRITAGPGILDEITRRAMTRRQSLLLEREPALQPAFVASGRRLRTLHCMPIGKSGAESVGGLALVRQQEAPLDASEWALLASFSELAAQAVDRVRRFAHEHDLAVQLQRSLLPEALPHGVGTELAGHYRAGGAGVEVGGDWYDAVRRPDGILHLCVGDVIGRGIGAATLMGRYRSFFRAYAYECASPGEIVRRMLRHVDDEETMITVACVSLDPYSGEVRYSCAGHPPPLLVDRDAGTVTRLEHASSPPLGVAEVGSIQEATVRVGPRVTLVLYSDGLIERRGSNIDDGIDLLGDAFAEGEDASIEEILGRVADGLGAPTDDAALLVATLTGEQMPFEVEIESNPSELPELRRRLRAWLTSRLSDGVEEVLLAVGEACNNAVEHAYGRDRGAVWIHVDEDGSVLRATIRDEGRWNDSESGEDRGRGVSIMHALMDTADIRETPGGTEVVLELRLQHHDLGASQVTS
jgi:serine phosphatase RsbU (regulator of sigma subunit)/anti-sigma regulatory factor (Ser/Thr protein kinase)